MVGFWYYRVMNVEFAMECACLGGHRGYGICFHLRVGVWNVPLSEVLGSWGLWNMLPS